MMQFERCEAVGEVGVGPYREPRSRRAGTHDRNAQLVRQVSNAVEKQFLLARRTAEHFVDLVEHQNPYARIGKDRYHLASSLTRGARASLAIIKLVEDGLVEVDFGRLGRHLGEKYRKRLATGLRVDRPRMAFVESLEYLALPHARGPVDEKTGHATPCWVSEQRFELGQRSLGSIELDPSVDLEPRDTFLVRLTSDFPNLGVQMIEGSVQSSNSISKGTTISLFASW